MNRRNFLFRIIGGSAAVATGIALAEIKPYIQPVVVSPIKKHYPILDGNGEFCPMAPENAAIRMESHRLVEEHKRNHDKKAFGLIFASAHQLWLDKNCAEAMYRARIASRELPRGWQPPKEVMLLSKMLTEYGVRYSKKTENGKGCRYAKI